MELVWLIRRGVVAAGWPPYELLGWNEVLAPAVIGKLPGRRLTDLQLRTRSQ